MKNLSFLIWTLLRKPWLYVSFINLKKIISIAKLTFNIIKGKLLTNRIEVPANKNLGILSIAVDPMFKRRNIGTLLLNEVDSLAERLNSNVIQLTVAPYNKSAITFYLKCGWQKVAMGHNWQGLMKKHLRVNSDS